MIRFGAFAARRFKGGPFYPLILAIVKFTGAILAECGSAYLIVQASNVKGTLGAFLGMSIVANIDNYMAKTITEVNIGAEMGKEKIKYPKNGESFMADWLEMKRWNDEVKMGLFNWLIRLFLLAFHRLFKLFYVVAYFYFAPFMVLILNMVLRDSQPDFE